MYNTFFYCYAHTHIDAHSVLDLIFETFAHIYFTEQESTSLFILTAITAKPKPPISCPSISLLNKRKSFWQDDAQHGQARPRSFMNKLEMKV